MAIGGSSINRSDPERDRRNKEESERLRDYPIEELSGLITIEEVLIVNNYQTKTYVSELLEKPLPADVLAKNPLGSIAVKGNTMIFTDEIEDKLESDPKIKEILSMPSTAERAQLLRTRRSVLGYLLLNHALPQAGVA